MVQHRSLIRWMASISEKALGAFGARDIPAVLRPLPLTSNMLPVRRAFSGPLAFASGVAVADDGHRAALTNARRPVLVGVIIILVAFVGFGGWAAVAPIDSAAIASGTVAV